jgi:hypothetical protein
MEKGIPSIIKMPVSIKRKPIILKIILKFI